MMKSTKKQTNSFCRLANAAFGILLTLALISTLLPSLALTPAAAESPITTPDNPGYDSFYQAAGQFIAAQKTELPPAVGSEWAILGLARAGYPVPAEYYNNYFRAVSDYVKENINDAQQLHSSRSTDNSRIILALTALGYDVETIEGHNLLAGLTDLDYVNKQGVTGPVWALLAFDAHHYQIPANESAARPVTREKLIDCIFDARLSDGGWTYWGTEMDVEMTSIVLQALAPYYSTDTKVKEAVDTALAKLSQMQNPDGSYSCWGEVSSEVCAQVLVALTALGIDPETDERFMKNGRSVLDALCTFCTDEGGFCHTLGGPVNNMSTEQGYYALAAYDRFQSGKTSLYNMSDVEIRKNTPGGGSEQLPENEQQSIAPEDNETLSPATGVSSAVPFYLGLILVSFGGLVLSAAPEYKTTQNKASRRTL